MDRTPGCGPGGWRFDSSRAHKRRSARVVYLAGFENRAGCKTYTGSNPVSSAKNMKYEFSAGGIVLKKTPSKNHKEAWILISQHSGHHGWVFPKGKIGDHIEDESREETALREVKEETGIVGKIIKPLAPVTYWYELRGERVKKTAYYFLMEYVSGDITKHDYEMENVEWILKEDVEKRLTFESDKMVWQEASKTI